MNSTNLTSVEEDAGPAIFHISPINIFYAAIGVFGFLGNGMSTLVFHRLSSILSKSTRILFIHQAVVDSAFSLLLTIRMVTPALHQVSNLDPTSAWDRLYCEILLDNKFFWLLNMCSVYSMLCLTFDRFLAIVKPGWYALVGWESVLASKVYCTILIFLVWAIALPSNFAVILYAVTPSGSCAYFPTAEGRIFAYCYITLKLFLPVLLLVVFYSLMLTRLKKHIHSMDEINNGQANNPASATNLQKSKKRLFTLFVVIASLFVICFMPNQIFFFARQMGAPLQFGSSLHTATVTLLYLNTSVYPVVYVVTLPPFRMEMRKLCGCTLATVASYNSNANNGGTGSTPGVHN